MSRMFRSNSSVGSRSKSSMSSLQDIVNKDYTIEENINDFSKWNILKINIMRFIKPLGFNLLSIIKPIYKVDCNY